MGAFLESLDHLAREAGLVERSTEPQAAVRGAAVSWLPIEMNVRGSFEAIYAFVESLERLPRVARVQEWVVESSVDAEALLSSTLTMHVYFKKS